MTMRVVIVDDEPIARRGLRHLLAAHDDVVVVGEARNGIEAVHVLKEFTPDLVLLDVQMPECDGFDVLRRLDGPLPAVIFVTAYDAYAVRAFESYALDYLVKPVHEDRFRDAIARAHDRLRSAAAVELASRLARLLELRELAASDTVLVPARQLIVPAGHGELLVDVVDIQWIEADDYYAAIYTHGRRHLVRQSLDSLARHLDPERFIRAHRSAIVNLGRVREMRVAGGAAQLVLVDGTRVPISRRRRRIVAEAVRRFVARPPA